jgi:hypothetical protein
MMKRITTITVAVAIVSLLSQSALADPIGTRGAPDAGTTSALLLMAIGGLAALKRFLR